MDQINYQDYAQDEYLFDKVIAKELAGSWKYMAKRYFGKLCRQRMMVS